MGKGIEKEDNGINQETYMGTIPILKEERLYSFSDITLSSAGFGIASWCYVQGAWIASTVGFSAALIISIVPVILAGLFLMLLVIIPTRYGVDLWMYQRAVFGHRLAFLLCILSVLITWGWYAINCGVFAGSMVQLGAYAGFELSHMEKMFSIICAVIGCLIALRGPYLVKIATYIMVPALIIIGVILLVKVMSSTTLAELSSFKPIYGDTYPNSQIAFLCTTEIMFAFVFGWYPVLGGLSRLGKSEKGSYWGQFLGFCIAMCVFTVIGCVSSTLISGRFNIFTSNPADWLSILNGPVWAVISIITIAIANISTQMMGVYCLGIAVKVFKPDWSYKWIAVGLSSFCIVLIIWEGIWTYYNVFLAIIAFTAVPACGIIFVDFFLVRKDKFSLKACFRREGNEAYSYTQGFNLVAVFSFVIGIVFYLITYDPVNAAIRNQFLMKITPTGAALISSSLAYYLLCKIPKLRSYVVREDCGTFEKKPNIRKEN